MAGNVDAARPQHAPIANTTTPIIDLVIRDLEVRAEDGRRKYGSYLQAMNGRNALIDAYQEALDLCMYLRQRIEEDALSAAAQADSANTARRSQG